MLTDGVFSVHYALLKSLPLCRNYINKNALFDNSFSLDVIPDPKPGECREVIQLSFCHCGESKLRAKRAGGKTVNSLPGECQVAISFVIPAQAGIQFCYSLFSESKNIDK
ncbi:MAG: hypothetical protein CVU55_10470 [Deltaproteobacteria bacterium HGW-Deltaproteobacteria-13]|nr:MAG: hypothetical protein CVU55_10470 [Deltaproteobacteria bacterium HGW-Deltaproteobacteria-13]